MKLKKLSIILALACVVGSVSISSAAMRGSVTASNRSGVFKTYTSTDSITTKYLVTPAYPDNILLQVLPQQACTINVHIVNTNGTEVLAIGSTAVTYRLVKSVNIATLSAGNYYIEFVSGSANSKKYSIPFTVSQ